MPRYVICIYLYTHAHTHSHSQVCHVYLSVDLSIHTRTHTQECHLYLSVDLSIRTHTHTQTGMSFISICRYTQTHTHTHTNMSFISIYRSILHRYASLRQQAAVLFILYIENPPAPPAPAKHEHAYLSMRASALTRACATFGTESGISCHLSQICAWAIRVF